MFQKAFEIARGFTKPIILSHRKIDGACSSGIGAYVVVNSDGWIVTASHIMEGFLALRSQRKQAVDREAERKAIEDDQSLDLKAKKKRFSKLPHLAKNHVDRVSAWWGHDGVRVCEIAGLPDIDLAVARLEPFDPAWVPNYPTFKDPSKNFVPGTSLCKLGYPFHRVAPTWNATTGGFVLPSNAVPLPLFPIDGIFTRVAQVLPKPGQPTPPFPLLWVETSTPGLRGQSGGPTFDAQGRVWAIQARTANLPLGFDPPVPNGKPGEREHQFLNVGLGVHPETMFGFFRDVGIKFTISAD